MLANPRHSRILLINPTRNSRTNKPESIVARRQESLSLLAAAHQLFGVPIYVVGEYDRSLMPDALARIVLPLNPDDLSLWHDQALIDTLASAEAVTLFMAGAWLDEEVLVNALQAARLGYDVRVFCDLSLARIEADVQLGFSRLAAHGVLVATLRQTCLEWAISSEDAELQHKARQLLSGN